jgi:hypothetical protein
VWIVHNFIFKIPYLPSAKPYVNFLLYLPIQSMDSIPLEDGTQYES